MNAVEARCEKCGRLVDLSVKLFVQVNGGKNRKMTEARARELCRKMGITPPPLVCSIHAQARLDIYGAGGRELRRRLEAAALSEPAP